MGNSNAETTRSSFLYEQNQLLFYTQTHDQNLGLVKIYTSKNSPLRYILKHQHMSQDTRIFNIFQKVQNLQSPALLEMYGFSISRQNCCSRIVRDRIISYWDYHNFYLDSYLIRRIDHNCAFIDSQIWHIVDICCQTFHLFKKFQIYYEIDIKTFVVTPQGKLKSFWAHLRTQNHHLKFIKYFQTHKIENFFYSPQQIQCIYQNQRSTKINFQKCNSFRLGMLLLQCLSMSDPLKLCYNPSMTDINFLAIKSIIFRKVVPNYGEDIIHLLKRLLSPNPRDRPTLEQVYNQYCNHFNAEFQLRVCPSNKKQDYENGSANTYRRVVDESNTKTVKIKRSHRIN